MKTYYKATRPDGRDFYSGTINYAHALETGELIRHPAAKRKQDNASTYLSVSIVPTDCTRMKWPCRLFRVQGVGRPMKAAAYLPNKRCFSAIKVLEELPSWQVFGPQGREVEWVLKTATTLTDLELSSFPPDLDVNHPTWLSAWKALRYAVRYEDAAWCALRDVAYDIAWGHMSTRTALWFVIRNAAVAYMFRGTTLNEGHFGLLAGPWLDVVGGMPPF